MILGFLNKTELNQIDWENRNLQSMNKPHPNHVHKCKRSFNQWTVLTCLDSAHNEQRAHFVPEQTTQAQSWRNKLLYDRAHAAYQEQSPRKLINMNSLLMRPAEDLVETITDQWPVSTKPPKHQPIERRVKGGVDLMRPWRDVWPSRDD